MTVVANVAAKSRIVLEALGRPIVVFSLRSDEIGRNQTSQKNIYKGVLISPNISPDSSNFLYIRYTACETFG